MTLFDLSRPTVDPALVNETSLVVDFGDNGGFAWNDDGKLRVQDMPERLYEIRDFIEYVQPSCVWGENVHAFPGQGVSSVETFIRGQARIEGLLSAMRIKLNLIQPEEWTRWYDIGKRKDFQRMSRGGMRNDTTAWKKHLQAHALERYPYLPITLKTADAVLMWNFVNNPQRIRKIQAPSFK